ncbi:MAG: hypothetical protein WKF90_03005 [Pyrinomonadaceae bacterium]|jgi:hypothetical protein
MKMFFRGLIDNEVISKNPAQQVKQLSENERQFHVITDLKENFYIMACSQPLRDVASVMI